MVDNKPRLIELANGILRWLQTDQPPTDIYELLGSPRFDPDHGRMLDLIRVAYQTLQPYQNHSDPRIVDRAIELQMELGRAEVVLSDPGKLRAYHNDLARKLRAEYAATHPKADFHDIAAIQTWLAQQNIRSEQLPAVAKAVRDTSDDTTSIKLGVTQSAPPLPGSPPKAPVRQRLRVFGVTPPPQTKTPGIPSGKGKTRHRPAAYSESPTLPLDPQQIGHTPARLELRSELREESAGIAVQWLKSIDHALAGAAGRENGAVHNVLRFLVPIVTMLILATLVWYVCRAYSPPPAS